MRIEWGRLKRKISINTIYYNKSQQLIQLLIQLNFIIYKCSIKFNIIKQKFCQHKYNKKDLLDVTVLQFIYSKILFLLISL